VLRRAHWRKIELEYEVDLAEKMGFLDPLHLVKYQDWQNGGFRSRLIDAKRKHYIDSIFSNTAFKLFNNSHYHPMAI
jgi:hypothetical protein